MTFRFSTGWMWSEACQLLEQAERLQRQFFQVGVSGSAGPRWEPPVDVFEGDEELVVVVALPGVSAENIEAVSEAGYLTVRALRPIPFSREAHLIHRLEIPYGYFERRIPLPLASLRPVAQEFVNGCLFLRLRNVLEGNAK